jgi:thiol-disulfide isomerase/thioredoxin
MCNSTMMKRIGLLALIAFVLAACGGSTPPPAAVAPGKAVIAPESKLLDTSQVSIPEAGQAAPDFEYTLADGSTHKLSDLRGKKVLLNFWATWCAPCRTEMPDLQKVLDESGGSIGVLGVNNKEQAELIGPFADELGVGFTLIANPPGDIVSRYAVTFMPTSYFINSDGTIGLRKTGVMNYNFIKSHLDQLK